MKGEKAVQRVEVGFALCCFGLDYQLLSGVLIGCFGSSLRAFRQFVKTPLANSHVRLRLLGMHDFGKKIFRKMFAFSDVFDDREPFTT